MSERTRSSAPPVTNGTSASQTTTLRIIGRYILETLVMLSRREPKVDDVSILYLVISTLELYLAVLSAGCH